MLRIEYVREREGTGGGSKGVHNLREYEEEGVISRKEKG